MTPGSYQVSWWCIEPSGSMIALVPTVEMFTTMRPVSIARIRAIASCCTFSSVRPKSALFVCAKHDLRALLDHLGHQLVVDDVEADRDAGEHAAPPVFALPTSSTASVVPGVYSRPIRSIRSGANMPPERAVGHVLAERHRVLLVVVVDLPLARMPERRGVEVVVDLVAVRVDGALVARRDDAGDERRVGPARRRRRRPRPPRVRERVDVGRPLRPDHDVDVLVEDGAVAASWPRRLSPTFSGGSK